MNLLVKSALVGFGIGSVPVWMWVVFRESLTLPAFQDGVNYLLFPGIVVGLVFSGGRAHDVSRAVIVLSSCLFYTALSYVIFRARKKSEVKS
jgi:hypothetical protein